MANNGVKITTQLRPSCRKCGLVTEPRLPTDDPKPLSLEPTHRRSQIHLVNPGDPRASRLETDGVPGLSAQAVVETRTVVSSHLIQGTLALCACPP